MLYRLILQKAQEWLTSEGCTIRPLLDYINANGNLREAQVQALLVYLFLKIGGGNKRLGTLFAEGFFSRPEDLSSLNINQAARAIFEANPAARALFDLSRTPINGNGHGKKNQKTYSLIWKNTLWHTHGRQIIYPSARNFFTMWNIPTFCSASRWARAKLS